MLNKDAITTFLKDKTLRPVSLKEIAKGLCVSKKEFRPLKRLLGFLTASGEIVKTRASLYGPAEKMNLVSGLFEAHRDGYGFVLPDRPGERDLFVPARNTFGAMDGDRVIVRVESWSKREARVIRVLERRHKRVVGRLEYGKNFYYVEPKNKKIPFNIYIGPRERGGAKSGDIVVAELTSYPTPERQPEGRVLKVLTQAEEPKLEIDMIIEEFSLPRKFPKSVLDSVQEITEEVSHHGRVDCRQLLTVTIDGEMARDFDDAISIRKDADGFTLWVHIADVSHYVPWNSALDLEARRRGTSVYFPDRVIPMLPKELSNHICSLNPKADRATLTVEMQFDKKGNIKRQDVYPSIINSNERMTYTSVRKILVDNDQKERHRYSYLLRDFEVMEELCEILRQRRLKRGSLDFDLPEPEVLLDIQGRPEAIIKAERNLAHRIIEEFMIAANEAVAEYLTRLAIPSIYRIHEEPDPVKLEDTKPLWRALGIQLRKTEPRVFQGVIEAVQGRPEEALINNIILRLMKQARYSDKNVGHFGLASECYTHFTSPIRRYPDLAVHRILKDSLKKKGLSDKKRKYLEGLLPEIAFHSSRMERVADEAERDVVNAMRVWFMRDTVGDEYEGFITGITPYGLSVQLKDFFVEGFMHVSFMPDDYYKFNEERYCLTGRHKKKSYTIGQEVRVRIERVDIEVREIVLAMA
ncbi:MAG TPA: ribonuclease R [Nitrospiraceae bacterium]|nr:ribonuclease R [Nitrospiraceae bacterium]